MQTTGTSFQRMDNYYRKYIAEQGRPDKVFCNYSSYFDFLHNNPLKTNLRPRFKRYELDKAEPGTLVLWVYPYERQSSGIEPDYFYSEEALAEVEELKSKGKNYLHLIHKTRPPWRELKDFSDVDGLDDKWPFFQKVLIKE